MKYLVTSGCSFSDNGDNGAGRWQNFLHKKFPKTELISLGMGGKGNGYIARTIICTVQNLLNDGVDHSDIVVGAMWTGFDRDEIYISNDSMVSKHTSRGGVPNPVNPLDRNYANLIKDDDYDYSAFPRNGWIDGTPGGQTNNQVMQRYMDRYFKYYHDAEGLLIKSIEHMLRLQWFLETKGIKYFCLTYCDIMHHPTQILWDENAQLIDVNYPIIKPYYDMIDFSKWFLWHRHGGLYEYTKAHKLPFYSDDFHPLPESHRHFALMFLYPRVRKLLR